MTIIAPSILSADFLNLGKDIEMINSSQAEWIHIDVMDGVFVPNISYGIPIVKAVKKITKKPLDVHLMIVQPERYFEAFRDAGADIITFHYEASVHLNRSIALVRELGMKVGVVLNPHTPVNVLSEILPELDLVLIMSVNPGFGGQKFIENTYQKVKSLKQMIQSTGKDILIEVDGGVDFSNAAKLFRVGVNVLVAGNTVFSAADPKEAIARLLTSR
ncbi:MAG: ribulose-phosphate 3-epimerase [Lentimicrobiaceae bacterium]|jgi:ribulose-phosphate 3-epimerase